MRSFLKLRPLLLAFVLLSCAKNFFPDDYYDAGQFSDRVEAEKKVLKHLTNAYAQLPESDCKVRFTFDVDATPGFIWNTDAIWYNRKSRELAFEHDLYSGKSCTWRKVNLTILNQLMAANKGLVMADSLAEPTYGSYQKSIKY